MSKVLAGKEISQDLETLITWGVRNLNTAIAIDSQSDEKSASIPSTEGQKELSARLKVFFVELGYETTTDDFANLMVHIPSNLPEESRSKVSPIAMMVHLDTSEGTFPIPALLETPAWDGTRLSFPDNERLHVSQEVFPETAFFVGQDLLHGTGASPVGLDNKLGMSEIMTLAQVLQANPGLPHGDVYLVFRPDEEIGRMEAVEGLAETFVERGIRYGYTIDGLDPFEINVENFNASRATIAITGAQKTLSAGMLTEELTLKLFGVKSHGATAKAEGYCNALLLFTEAMHSLGQHEVIPVDFASNSVAEVDATITFWLRGEDDAALDALEKALRDAFDEALSVHKLRGAFAEWGSRAAFASGTTYTDEVLQMATHLQTFLHTPGVSPLLSEQSEGYEGYTTPYFAERAGEGRINVDYRVRAFTSEERAQREAHLQEVCAGVSSLSIEVTQQYINMGPKMKAFPELVTWAKQAALDIGVEPLERPIRGGTGVDPFLAKGVPIANLGTGYFAPESEKEFTSRQTLGRHVLWLVALVQVIAADAAGA